MFTYHFAQIRLNEQNYMHFKNDPFVLSVIYIPQTVFENSPKIDYIKLAFVKLFCEVHKTEFFLQHYVQETS